MTYNVDFVYRRAERCDNQRGGVALDNPPRRYQYSFIGLDRGFEVVARFGCSAPFKCQHFCGRVEVRRPQPDFFVVSGSR